MASSSFWSNIFGQAPSDNEPSASVLAEWNKYSTDAAGECSILHLPRTIAPLNAVSLNTCRHSKMIKPC